MDDLAELDILMSEFSPEDPVDERFKELYDRRLHNVWAKFINDPDGRFLIFSILDKCHVFGSTYTGNAASNFLEGERNVGLQILRQHIFPQGYHVLGMLMEEADLRHQEIMSQAEQQVTNDRAAN